MSSSSRNMDTSNPENTLTNNDFLVAQYQVLANRQFNHSNILWSIPTMLFVGQTLLWNIALDVEIGILFRRLVAIVAVLISFMAFQLYLRNRRKEIAECKQLYSIEKYMLDKHGSESAIIIFETIDKRTLLPGTEDNLKQVPLGKPGKKPNKIITWVSDLSSYYTGTIIFISFIMVSLAIFIFSWF